MGELIPLHREPGSINHRHYEKRGRLLWTNRTGWLRRGEDLLRVKIATTLTDEETYGMRQDVRPHGCPLCSEPVFGMHGHAFTWDGHLHQLECEGGTA